MNVSGLVRLTADAVISTTKSGKQVLQIKAVCNNGFGDNQRPVWIDAAMFGDRGAKIVDYLKKGHQAVLHGDQVEAEGYQGRDGIQVKIKMNLINVELVARSEQGQAPQQKCYVAPQESIPVGVITASPNAALPNGNDFDDFSDSIPF